MTVIERNDLIVNYLPLAEKLARSKSRMTPKSVQYEDLKSAAYFGLVDAARKFDGGRNVSFYAYAKLRINGEMQDYLRQLAWGPRKNIKSVFTIEEDMFSQNDKPANEFFQKATKSLNKLAKSIILMYYVEELSLKEIGEKIGVSESRISQLLKEARNSIRANLDYSEACDEIAA
jgi:RNA polymerase sigma factor for flagellar operon FliA